MISTIIREKREMNRETVGISFKSLNEAINFRNSLKLEAFLFIVALFKNNRRNPLNKIPYLIDYNKTYTNNDIFDYFNIDKDIRNEIINNMQIFTYKSKLSGNDIEKTLTNIRKKYLNILSN